MKRREDLNKIDIFQCKSAAEFLRSHLDRIQNKNPKYSIRAWANKLKIENATTLIRILNESRPLTLKFAKQIGAQLSLTPEESKYFFYLSELSRLKKNTDIEEAHRLAKKYDQLSSNLSLESLQSLCNWYFPAILEALALKNTPPGYLWLKKKIRFSISSQGLKTTILNLEKLGFIEKTSTGRYIRIRPKRLSFHQNISDSIFEAFLASHLEISQKAFKELPISECKMMTATIAINENDIQEAKAIIDEATTKLLRLAKLSKADQVYQFNSQFFRLTNP